MIDSTKQWILNLFRDETRGAKNAPSIELEFKEQETGNSQSPQLGEAIYQNLIAALQQQQISDSETRQLLKALVAEFPSEGVPELVETMRDIQDFYMQKRSYIPQPYIRFEQKQIVITGTYIRPSFTVASEE